MPIIDTIVNMLQGNVTVLEMERKTICRQQAGQECLHLGASTHAHTYICTDGCTTPKHNDSSPFYWTCGGIVSRFNDWQNMNMYKNISAEGNWCCSTSDRYWQNILGSQSNKGECTVSQCLPLRAGKTTTVVIAIKQRQQQTSTSIT